MVMMIIFINYYYCFYSHGKVFISLEGFSFRYPFREALYIESNSEKTRKEFVSWYNKTCTCVCVFVLSKFSGSYFVFHNDETVNFSPVLASVLL